MAIERMIQGGRSRHASISPSDGPESRWCLDMSRWNHRRDSRGIAYVHERGTDESDRPQPGPGGLWQRKGGTASRFDISRAGGTQVPAPGHPKISEVKA